MINELVKAIAQGIEYKKFDDNGKAFGCMMPIYFLYPWLPRFDSPENIGEFMREMFKKYFQVIEFKDMQAGDLILIRLPFSLVHPAVYVGNDEMVDCVLDTGLQKSRLVINSRIEGVFRCQHRGD